MPVLAAGYRFGPYEIIQPLGAGGMGEVYRAVDQRLGRTIAIKLLPDAIRSVPEAVERFRREARSASMLNHPHIVTIHDIGECEQGFYIRSEEHTSELQSPVQLVCRLLLEKKKQNYLTYLPQAL